MSDIDTLARTIWGEARGELHGGQVAVANVVLNRIAAASWYGDTIEQVCRKPWQFSCWNDNDPNRKHMLALRDAEMLPMIAIAKAAAEGRLGDVTFGSTHYHNLTVSPDWAEDQTPVIQIGNHLFYNSVK